MSENEKPLVSVLLPVYNGELYLAEAIQSILGQSYVNFELIILSALETNQASLDVIASFTDPRIRHMRRTAAENNLPKALNLGIDESKGKYIARMDADDIALPHRLEREVFFMENNPDIAIAGAWAETFGAKVVPIQHPAKPAEVKVNLLFQTSLVHPTVIMRKEILDKEGLRYNGDLKYCEDVDLWIRACEKVKLANIKEVLLRYRTHDKQATHQQKDVQFEIKAQMRKKQLEKIGLIPTPRELELHWKIAAFGSEQSEDFLHEVASWLMKIADANRTALVYDQKVLEEMLAERWFVICSLSTRVIGVKSWSLYQSEVLSHWHKKTLRNKLRLAKFFATSRVPHH